MQQSVVITLIVIAVIVAILVFFVLSVYNGLVRLRNGLQERIRADRRPADPAS